MTAARLPGSPRPSSTMRSPAIRAAQTSFSLASRCGVSMAIAAKSRILLILKNFCGAPAGPHQTLYLNQPPGSVERTDSAA